MMPHSTTQLEDGWSRTGYL